MTRFALGPASTWIGASRTGSKIVRIRVQPSDIQIPKDNPFEHDRLDRKETVEILAGLIGSVEGPCVLGIDADWGNGKTTFLRMLNQCLVNKGIPVVSFNAWESDYASDPFTAIATELTDVLGGCPRTRHSRHPGFW